MCVPARFSPVGGKQAISDVYRRHYGRPQAKGREDLRRLEFLRRSLHEVLMVECVFLKKGENSFRDLAGKQWRHSIPHLVVLLGSWALKEIIIREGLQPGRFANCEATALGWFVVDKVMAIFADV